MGPAGKRKEIEKKRKEDLRYLSDEDKCDEKHTNPLQNLKTVWYRG